MDKVRTLKYVFPGENEGIDYGTGPLSPNEAVGVPGNRDCT